MILFLIKKMKVCTEFLGNVKSQSSFFRQNIVYYLRDRVGSDIPENLDLPSKDMTNSKKQRESEPADTVPKQKRAEKNTEPKEIKPSKDLRWLCLKVGDVEITYEKYKRMLVSVLGNKKIKKLSKKYQTYNLVHETIILTEKDIEDVSEVFKDFDN